MTSNARQIKVGNVRLEIKPVAGRWRFEWQDGKRRRMISSASEEIAVRRARIKALELSSGVPDFALLPPAMSKAVGDLLALDPSPDDLREFAAWLETKRGSGATLGEVVGAFLTAKHKGRGLSYRWTELLAWASNKLLARFGESRRMGSVTTVDLAHWIDECGFAPRTRKTLRDFAVLLWKWAAVHGHLADAGAAEKLASVKVQRKTPETLEPDQLKAALAAVSPRFAPWLVLSAFGLLRSAELYATGEKSPLAWEDLLWEQGIIRIRPETAKTGRKRVAPLHPVIRAWIWPLRASGAICRKPNPYNSPRKQPETQRLAKVIGLDAWPQNVLRHSAISYRAAAVGLGLASMEAGNSESEARRSYNDAKTAKDAEIWFGLTPKAVGRKWPEKVSRLVK